VLLILGPAVGVAGAQSAPLASASRKATTLAALNAYTVFYNTQHVRVRGTVEERDLRYVLRRGDDRVTLAGIVSVPQVLAPDAEYEATGTFLDVGRLEPTDTRLAGLDVSALWRQEGRQWPSPGELKVLRLNALVPADPFLAPSVRALALDPGRFADQRVTVTGRFQGNNLYGHLPDAPSGARRAFVLQLADGAVWVTGLQPKGSGFNLDVNARVDTNRWLEVSGVVTVVRGVAVIEGQLVALGTPPSEPAPSEPVARVRTVGPPVEVVFSLPTQGETDVKPGASVRIQFSREIDRTSIAGRVLVAYGAAEAPVTDATTPPIEFTTSYVEGSRTLEIRFARPLQAYRPVTISLLEGIVAADGAAFVPWTLTFTAGS
jgi:predicted RecA/RadA family phage recombinase